MSPLCFSSRPSTRKMETPCSIVFAIFSLFLMLISLLDSCESKSLRVYYYYYLLPSTFHITLIRAPNKSYFSLGSLEYPIAKIIFSIPRCLLYFSFPLYLLPVSQPLNLTHSPSHFEDEHALINASPRRCISPFFN